MSQMSVKRDAPTVQPERYQRASRQNHAHEPLLDRVEPQRPENMLVYLTQTVSGNLARKSR